MAEKLVIFQGTFDPFTNGHLAVLEQAVNLFGAVRVLLLINPDKKPLFSIAERKEMILACTSHLPGVSVDSYEGLLVDYMRERNLTVCVRGVRSGIDVAYELQNDRLSRALYPQLRTFLLACAANCQSISSSALKAACAQGQIPAGWVPDIVRQAMLKKLSL